MTRILLILGASAVLWVLILLLAAVAYVVLVTVAPLLGLPS